MSTDEELEKQLSTMHDSWDMAPEEAKSLEKQVNDGDDSLEPRLKLLGYYCRAKFRSLVNKTARIKHIAWMITNCPAHFCCGMPECSVDRGFDRWRDFYYISKLWREQVKLHWSQPEVIGNAGNCHLLNQIELAKKYFLRAKELEPDNRQWSDRLAQLYKFLGPTYEDLALREKEESYRLSKQITERLGALRDLAKLAYAAGEYEKTNRYAAELLELAESSKQEKAWQFEYQSWIEAAHIALGRLALRQGDINAASQHLLQTLPEKRGEMDGLDPDRQLVAELFAAGERASVLVWVERCKQYLKIPDWKERVERGDSPWLYELPERHRYFCLSRLPRSSFNSGEFDKSEKFATEFIELTKEFPNEKRHTGFGLHTAYNVLGQLALKAGDLDTAKARLMQAASVPFADRLEEEGPDLYLAAELTKLNETKVVCEFLKNCKRLWGRSSDASLLKIWQAEVAEGKVPDDWLIFLEPI